MSIRAIVQCQPKSPVFQLQSYLSLHLTSIHSSEYKAYFTPRCNHQDHYQHLPLPSRHTPSATCHGQSYCLPVLGRPSSSTTSNAQHQPATSARLRGNLSKKSFQRRPTRHTSRPRQQHGLIQCTPAVPADRYLQHHRTDDLPATRQSR